MRTRERERGSALLIVFVFAAVIGIMLYREMPVVVFEAHRQKEELLIDRGEEYKHAIKLYVRKLGTFPPSIEALENTNRMRFLRHKFDDPLTGKDDWRILHAGPGGMIIDSKVKTDNKLDANGKPVPGNANSNQTAGAFSGFGNNSGSSFGNNSGSIFGSSSESSSGSSFGSSSDSTPEMVVAAVPQRAPAIAANGSNKTAATDDLLNTQPGESLVPRSRTPAQADPAALPDPAAQADPNATAQTAAASPAADPGTGAPPASSNDPQGMMRSMLNASPNPKAPNGQQPTTNRMGTIMSGGIAGVASKASGHSIKLINDQDNYSLWEFYFDMRKEANAAFAAAQNRGSQMGPNGTANPANPSSNTFGSSNKGFSLSNNSSSGFSLSNNNSGSTPNNTPAQSPQPFPNR
ncbi:MAG TPA: hypothetical protein VGK64_25725 [Bryobacteraceae bacterium]